MEINIVINLDEYSFNIVLHTNLYCHNLRSLNNINKDFRNKFMEIFDTKYDYTDEQKVIIDSILDNPSISLGKSIRDANLVKLIYLIVNTGDNYLFGLLYNTALQLLNELNNNS